MADAVPKPVGRLQLDLEDVPAEALWSLSIHNRDGYFEESPHGSYNMNSVIADPNADGSFTLNLAPGAG